jgi:hypothetical protein
LPQFHPNPIQRVPLLSFVLLILDDEPAERDTCRKRRPPIMFHRKLRIELFKLIPRNLISKH